MLEGIISCDEEVKTYWPRTEVSVVDMCWKASLVVMKKLRLSGRGLK